MANHAELTQISGQDFTQIVRANTTTTLDNKN